MGATQASQHEQKPMSAHTANDPVLLHFGPTQVQWDDENVFWFFRQVQDEMEDHNERIGELTEELTNVMVQRDRIWLVTKRPAARLPSTDPLALLQRRTTASLAEMERALATRAAELRAAIEARGEERLETFDLMRALTGELVRRFLKPDETFTLLKVDEQSVCLSVQDGEPVAQIVALRDLPIPSAAPR